MAAERVCEQRAALVGDRVLTEVELAQGTVVAQEDRECAWLTGKGRGGRTGRSTGRVKVKVKVRVSASTARAPRVGLRVRMAATGRGKGRSRGRGRGRGRA